MASVQQVYNTLKDLTNKEQKGFITPQVFNSLASLAQMNVYNEFFTELVEAKKLSRQGFELGRDKSVRKQKLEDLSYFVKRDGLSSSSNVFEKPHNYILGSNLSTPTRDFPVALVTENIEVFPTSVNRIELTYYKTPTSWVWGTKTPHVLPPNYAVYLNPISGVEVPDPLTMRDFMLPDHCIPELVSEIAKLLGVRLRDPNVQAFASREEATE